MVLTHCCRPPGPHLKIFESESFKCLSHLDANANKETKTRQTTVSSFKQEQEQCCQILAAYNVNLVSVFVPLTRNPKGGGGFLKSRGGGDVLKRVGIAPLRTLCIYQEPVCLHVYLPDIVAKLHQQ
jgi:hypothetical protein